MTIFGLVNFLLSCIRHSAFKTSARGFFVYRGLTLSCQKGRQKADPVRKKRGEGSDTSQA